MNPLDTPLAYDVIVLCGVESPGLCEVEGASSTRKWDERKGQGVSGATIVYTGDALGKFTVTFKLWLQEHWDTWESTFAPILSSKPLAKKPKALDIYHPYLDALGLNAVVVEDLGQPKQAADGVWEIPVKFIQYRAPKAASGKPNGAAASKTTNPSSAPEDAIDAKIRQLTDQAKSLV